MAKIFTKLNPADIVASIGDRCFKKLTRDAITPSGGYLTFSSPNSFTLSVVDNKKYWDGTLEYSTDTDNWSVWNGTDVLTADAGRLYVRGTNNTLITGETATTGEGAWHFGGSNISISGNIENLLDYKTVANGNHPTMTTAAFAYLFAGRKATPDTSVSEVSGLELPAMTLTTDCYCSMFAYCEKLIKAPTLPATKLANGCYRYMFYACKSLTIPPALPAITTSDYCYYGMFTYCTSLETVPSLPATEVREFAYGQMFAECTSLKALPSLPAKRLYSHCYSRMFYRCTNIILSQTRTEICNNEYRVPISGICDYKSIGLPEQEMFVKTGGEVTGDEFNDETDDGSTIEFNLETTYYTSNTVV